MYVDFLVLDHNFFYSLDVFDWHNTKQSLVDWVAISVEILKLPLTWVTSFSRNILQFFLTLAPTTYFVVDRNSCCVTNHLTLLAMLYKWWNPGWYHMVGCQRKENKASLTSALTYLYFCKLFKVNHIYLLWLFAPCLAFILKIKMVS